MAMVTETRTTYEVEEKEERVTICDNPACHYRGPEEDFVTFYTHTENSKTDSVKLYLQTYYGVIQKTGEVKSSLDFCHDCLVEMTDEVLSPEDSVSFDHNGIMTLKVKQPLLYESIPFVTPIMSAMVVLGSMVVADYYFGLGMAILAGLIVGVFGTMATGLVRRILVPSWIR